MSQQLQHLRSLQIEGDGRSVTQAVAQRLRQAILDGVFQPGERLRQMEIAAAIGVSHIPVREAFVQLAEEGLVTLRPQRGATVAAPDATYVHDVYEVLAILAGAAIESGVARMTDEQQQQILRSLEEYEATPRDQRPLRIKLHDRFHGSLYKAAGNAVLADLIATYGRQVTAFITLYKGQGDMPSHDSEHRALVEAVLRRDSAEARRVMETHLRHGRDNIVSRIAQAQQDAR